MELELVYLPSHLSAHMLHKRDEGVCIIDYHRNLLQNHAGLATRLVPLGKSVDCTPRAHIQKTNFAEFNFFLSQFIYTGYLIENGGRSLRKCLVDTYRRTSRIPQLIWKLVQDYALKLNWNLLQSHAGLTTHPVPLEEGVDCTPRPQIQETNFAEFNFVLSQFVYTGYLTH